MSQFRRVETKEAFEEVLRAERAILFFWVPWTKWPSLAQNVVEKWAQSHQSSVDVYRVDPAEQPFVVEWLTEQKKEHLAEVGSGAVAWLREGRVVAQLMNPLWAGRDELERQTLEAFQSNKGGPGSDPKN